MMKTKIHNVENQYRTAADGLSRTKERLRISNLDLKRTADALAKSEAITIPQAKEIDDLKMGLKRTEQFRAAADDQVRRQIKDIVALKKKMAN